MTGIAIALLLAVSVAFLAPVPRRVARVAGVRGPEGDTALLRRLRVPLAAGAGVAAWFLVGGTVGVLVGAAAGAVSWRVVSRVEAPSVVRWRRELERDLPAAVHLFGAALAAGAPVSGALRDVEEALPGPVADAFAVVRRRLDLGLDPGEVWRSVEGPLRPLGRGLARAHESGAHVVEVVERLADELTASARGRRAAAARAVEVRAAAPLGVCFLPAFVLLGVVPMVVGIFGSLHLFS
ncbi:MAG: type II secretion system F family protein [Marmoricola sp.]